MRISDWSSDVCSSDLHGEGQGRAPVDPFARATDGGLIGCGCSRNAGRGGTGMIGRMGMHSMTKFSGAGRAVTVAMMIDRKSVVEGKSVSGRVDLGGGWRLKKNKQKRRMNI